MNYFFTGIYLLIDHVLNWYMSPRPRQSRTIFRRNSWVAKFAKRAGLSVMRSRQPTNATNRCLMSITILGILSPHSTGTRAAKPSLPFHLAFQIL